ncbi:MAG TPA: MBL fold metallo-hydrolase [Steroidobacteraceae bacterium]|nr:MBL fold metallo-hydrolase [Steroidobacteraceae bacterium]
MQLHRCTLISLPVLTLFVLQAVCAATEPVIERTQIAEGIFQFHSLRDGYVPNANSVAVITDSDVLVYDTYTRPSYARIVLAELRKLTDKPIRYVVNSHWHPDHWSGNEVYAEAFPGVEIVATEETRQHMLNAANAWPAMFKADLAHDEADFARESRALGKQAGAQPELQKKREYIESRRAFTAELAGVHRTYPTLTFVDRLIIRHGGREFQFFSMTGDATGTTVLYLPKERILLTGDMFAYPEPYFTPPLSVHVRNLQALDAFDVDVIIPGHGPAWRNKDYLHREAQLLQAISSQVQQAEQRGLVTLAEVEKSVDVDGILAQFIRDDKALKDFEKYLRLDVKLMIRNAYREGRDGEEFNYDFTY